MPKLTPIEKASTVANAIKSYVQTFELIEWLMSNRLLPPNSDPHALAYSYAIRFNQLGPEITAIMEQLSK